MTLGQPVQRRVVGTAGPGKTPSKPQAIIKVRRAYTLNGCMTSGSLADRHLLIAGATTRADALPQPPAPAHSLRQHSILPRPQIDQDSNAQRLTASRYASTSGRRNDGDTAGPVLPTVCSGATPSHAQDARSPLRLPRSQMQPSRRQLLHAIAAVAVAAAAPMGGGLAGPGRAAAAERVATLGAGSTGSAVDLATIQVRPTGPTGQALHS